MGRAGTLVVRRRHAPEHAPSGRRHDSVPSSQRGRLECGVWVRRTPLQCKPMWPRWLRVSRVLSLTQQVRSVSSLTQQVRTSSPASGRSRRRAHARAPCRVQARAAGTSFRGSASGRQLYCEEGDAARESCGADTYPSPVTARGRDGGREGLTRNEVSPSKRPSGSQAEHCLRCPPSMYRADAYCTMPASRTPPP